MIASTEGASAGNVFCCCSASCCLLLSISTACECSCCCMIASGMLEGGPSGGGRGGKSFGSGSFAPDHLSKNFFMFAIDEVLPPGGNLSTNTISFTFLFSLSSVFGTSRLK